MVFGMPRACKCDAVSPKRSAGRTRREARPPNPRTAAIARGWRRIKFQDEPVNSGNTGRQ
jgi:hypothetical protein